MRKIVFVGFVIWLGATAALRLGGQFVFRDAGSFAAAVLLLVSVPLMILVARAVLADVRDRAPGAIALVAPGMLLDTFTTIWFTTVSGGAKLQSQDRSQLSPARAEMVDHYQRRAASWALEGGETFVQRGTICRLSSSGESIDELTDRLVSHDGIERLLSDEERADDARHAATREERIVSDGMSNHRSPEARQATGASNHANGTRNHECSAGGPQPVVGQGHVS